MITSIAFLVGRIIVGVYFLYNAKNHLLNGSHMVSYASSKGVKSPKLAITGSGVLLLLGGVSLLLGVYVTWGISLLLVFMIPVTYIMHSYWKESDSMAKMNEKIAFLKNIAIIGLLLMAYAVPLPWAFTF